MDRSKDGSNLGRNDGHQHEAVTSADVYIVIEAKKEM